MERFRSLTCYRFYCFHEILQVIVIAVVISHRFLWKENESLPGSSRYSLPWKILFGLEVFILIYRFYFAKSISRSGFLKVRMQGDGPREKEDLRTRLRFKKKLFAAKEVSERTVFQVTFEWKRNTCEIMSLIEYLTKPMHVRLVLCRIVFEARSIGLIYCSRFVHKKFREVTQVLSKRSRGSYIWLSRGLHAVRSFRRQTSFNRSDLWILVLNLIIRFIYQSSF